MVEINSRCPFKGGVRLKGSPIKESDWRKNGANLGFSLRDQNECLISVEESIKTELSVLLESYYWPLSRNSCTIRRGKFKQFSLLMITSWLIFLVVNVFISLIDESRDKDNCQKAHRLHWNNSFFEVSRRSTINSQLLQIPFFRTAAGQRTFFYRTVNLWNSLDNSFKLCNSIDVFKTRLRTKLLKEL